MIIRIKKIITVMKYSVIGYKVIRVYLVRETIHMVTYIY